jgi:ribose transport system substrate-binding protein
MFRRAPVSLAHGNGPLAALLVAMLLTPILWGTGCSRGSDTAGGGAGAKRIVILTNVPDPFWDTCEAGAKSAERELGLAEQGYRVAVEQNTKGVQGQIQRLREWAGDPSVVAVAVSVTDPENTSLIDAMRNLRDQGVQVITIDSDVNRDNASFREARHGFIGTDNVTAGEELGKAARGLLPQGGKYATFVGIKSQANAIQRDEGFKHGAGPQFVQTDFLGDSVDHSKARQNVRDALERHPDLALLVGLWAYNPPAIADVVDERARQGLQSDLTVVGFDAAPNALDAMARGRIQALVVQDPYAMGYRGVKTLKALLENDAAVLSEMWPNYGDTDGDLHETGLKVVVPAGSPLTSDLFREGTEFLTLDEFKAWLDQYGLTGS